MYGNEYLKNALYKKEYLAKGFLDSLSSAKIYGLTVNKTTAVATRTDDAFGLNTFISINGSVGVNGFDQEEIYKDMVTSFDTDGNKFTWVPKCYFSVIDTETTFTVKVSKAPFEGSFLSPIFWDFENNRELDYYLHGCYKGITVDGKLKSIPDTYPTINRNIVQFRTDAMANGVGYQQLDVHAHFVLTYLMSIELGDFNAQGFIQGFSTGQYTAAHTVTVAQTASNNIIVTNAVASNYIVGQGVALGTSLGGNQTFYGRTITAITVHDASNTRIVVDGSPFNTIVGNIVYNVAYRNGFSTGLTQSVAVLNANDGKTPFVYRGIESPFADIWQFVDGININDWRTWVCDDARNYASNVFASPYKALSYLNSNTNNWISRLGFDANNPTVLMPIQTTGSNTNWIGDYYWQSNGQRIALVGGYWNFGSYCGLSAWYLHISSSFASVTFCARLLKKPLL